MIDVSKRNLKFVRTVFATTCLNGKRGEYCAFGSHAITIRILPPLFFDLARLLFAGIRCQIPDAPLRPLGSPLNYRSLSASKRSIFPRGMFPNLFGFMFPAETKMNKPSPVLMDRVEEWIGMFKNPQNAALEVKGRSNTENLNSLLTYIEKKSMDIGKDMFDKVKADADAAGMAKNVAVGRAATPGTPERSALDALMKAEVPPKRRR